MKRNNTPPTILIVDDDLALLNSLKVLFNHSGYKVTEASSLEQAMDLLNEHYFDVVLMDYYLPDGEGSVIMNHCAEFCPKSRVIVMTGDATVETAIQALRSGAFDYIIKPFDFDLLFHTVQRAVEHINILEEISLAKERYRALIEDLYEGYMVLKEDYVPSFVNSKMAQMLGCTISQMLESQLWDFIDEGSRRLVAEKLKMLARTPGAFFLEEVIFRDCKGNTVPMEVRMTNTIGDYLGQGIIMICREITERDLLWKRLVRSERLATMGEMVAGVAHELNNKLTPILGFGEILAQSGNLPPETYEKCVNGINAAAASAKKIVESLLLFARQEKPAMHPCNLNDIVRNAVSLTGSWIGGSGINIEFDSSEESIPVKADSHQIEQVITNIIKNAIEASSGVNGHIQVETRLDDAGKHAILTITDNGPGIPEEYMDKIFDPFFSTKSKKKGTGLGLSICHGIIKEHGGTITVESRPGRTVFTVVLPAANAVASQDEATETVSDLNVRRPEKPRLLVVDDEFEISELLTEAFSDHFETEQAANGLEALEKIRSRNFDVIISDVRMPLLDGLELYRELEEHADHYCSRIVFTTGIASDFRTHKFLKQKGVPFLQKPFKLKELISVVNTILNRHEEPGNRPGENGENGSGLH